VTRILGIACSSQAACSFASIVNMARAKVSCYGCGSLRLMIALLS
jgi:hypothetical protein